MTGKHIIMGLSCECLMINSETTLTSKDYKMSILNIKDAIDIYIYTYFVIIYYVQSWVGSNKY
jgi:hypothetical protein